MSYSITMFLFHSPKCNYNILRVISYNSFNFILAGTVIFSKLWPIRQEIKIKYVFISVNTEYEFVLGVMYVTVFLFEQ